MSVKRGTGPGWGSTFFLGVRDRVRVKVVADTNPNRNNPNANPRHTTAFIKKK